MYYVAQLVKNPPAMLETWVRFLGWEDSLEKGKSTHSRTVFWPGEFQGLYGTWGCQELDTTEQLSIQQQSIPGGLVVKKISPCQCGRHGFPSLGLEDTLEKEMATHSSIFAWDIPWTEEPGGLQSMGSQKTQRWLSD